MGAPLIEMEHVSFRYEQTKALEDITLTVRKGDFLAILGPNGSGKSTLLKILLGLIKPTTGTVRLFGKDIRHFRERERIGYVSQKANSFNSGFPATVEEVVKGGLAKKTGLFRRFPESAEEDVTRALKAVGMETSRKRLVGELSGGQQQRVFIARALVSRPEVLILDEPTVGVDKQNVQSFYDMLDRLNKEQEITLILVTHDAEMVSDRISHVACLNRTMHFHGFKNEMERMSAEQLEAWYGHSVRKVHHAGAVR
ncbi:metal ABC transporter ATP-binding protein [Indiicoccus explosivorum]|uniref:metal ABC transporter ATP-binding protein n=1 Tax=Indiicoccus explosivorum TaxID=1917864 RepID=UPI000B42D989|nr:metal ABC transporter ATP-binding protein [Indiicoccus explosivorum]